MAHIVIQRKHPYTELQSVVLPCIEMTADVLHGEKNAVYKVRHIPPSDNAAKRRCLHISEHLLKKFLHVVFSSMKQQAFSAGEVQLIAYCRFADDEKTKTIVILDNANTSTHFKFSKICHFKPAKK